MTINELDHVSGEPLPSNGVSYEALTVLRLAFATDDKPDAVFQQPVQSTNKKTLSNKCEIMAARLKVWTAGLLEVRGSETAHVEVSGVFVPKPHAKIQYLHRTVRDFLEKRDEWDKIVSRTKGTSFEPYSALLGAAILELKTSSAGMWPELAPLLTFAMHAGFVTGHANTKLLDELDRVMEFQFRTQRQEDGLHWANYDTIHTLNPKYQHDSFLSLAVQFSLWGYIQEKLKGNKYLLVNSRGRPLLDSAVNPISVNKCYPVSCKVVEVLLHHGADPMAKFCNQTAGDQAVRWHHATVTSPKSAMEIFEESELWTSESSDRAANAIPRILVAMKKDLDFPI